MEFIPSRSPGKLGIGTTSPTKTLEVKIPAGVDTGARIRFTGEGEAGPRGGPSGNLYVVIRVRPHAVFERQGQDIACEVTISFASSANSSSETS